MPTMPISLIREKNRSSTHTNASAVKEATMPMIRGDWLSFAMAAITSGGTCGKPDMVVNSLRSDKIDVMEKVLEVLGDPYHFMNSSPNAVPGIGYFHPSVIWVKGGSIGSACTD
jgi:hypothetical protein